MAFSKSELFKFFKIEQLITDRAYEIISPISEYGRGIHIQHIRLTTDKKQIFITYESSGEGRNLTIDLNLFVSGKEIDIKKVLKDKIIETEKRNNIYLFEQSKRTVKLLSKQLEKERRMLIKFSKKLS